MALALLGRRIWRILTLLLLLNAKIQRILKVKTNYFYFLFFIFEMLESKVFSSKKKGEFLKPIYEKI